jgi:glycosyltransferase involved in cell wall biosynthesis
MHGGGALRSASLLHYLAAHADVDLIVFRQPGARNPAEDLPAGLVRRVATIDLPHHRAGAVARTARNAWRLVRRTPPLVDRFAGFESQLAAALAGQSYAVGVIEHSWCAPYWNQIAPVCRETVLDLHNIESVLHARSAAAERGARRLAHAAFARAALQEEREWLPRFSRTLVTSTSDAKLARERAPGARVSVYPNALPLVPLPQLAPDHAVVFSGNLEYHPNISAVRFFREAIWPLLRNEWPNLVWRLVGKNPHAVKAWTSGDSRIEVIGPVDDAIAELARAQVAVVPIRAGSGTRLKILEAWAAGVPVVSTRLGAEGLPVEGGEHLLLADDAARFAAAVSRLLTNEDLRLKLGAAGRRLFVSEFTWQAAWKNLDSFVWFHT